MDQANRGRRTAAQTFVICTFLLLVGLILGCDVAQNVRDKASRQVANEHMSLIGRSLRNLSQYHRQIPEDRKDKNGKPLLSWRVELLQDVNIKESALFRKFRMDEPWDSEHNLKLVDQMPDVFKSRGLELQPGHTAYQKPVGNGALFFSQQEFADASRKLPRITPEGIGKNARNTIMLVESDVQSSTIWTKPCDFQFDPNEPCSGLNILGNGEINVIMADGTFANINCETTSTEDLRNFFNKEKEPGPRK